ncbi:hypothetical protein DNTS_022878, partial [Danionella cerebrum]
MLRFNPTFDLQKDVVSSIFAREEKAFIGVLEPRILNVERDGGVVYSWRLLYTFDKQVCVSSCSLNKEETLLAVSLSQCAQGEGLKPVSQCLTLLIEIHPINNTKVLKAVDCKVKVQFLYPKTCRSTVLESHLLLAAEDGYVDLYHIALASQEGYRVVLQNPERLSKERVTEDFIWLQWDSENQRLFYLKTRGKHTLKAVQFYPDRNFETVFELPLEIHNIDSSSVRFVNFAYDHHEDLKRDDLSHPVRWHKDATYTIAFVHQGYYIVVYLADQFLHLINCRQQDLLCYSLFLSGADSYTEVLASGYEVVSAPANQLLDARGGRMYTVDLNPDFLLELLSPYRPEVQKLAALHCMLVYLQPNSMLELKELPVALTAIPGVKCTPELLCQPIIKGKAKSLQGYWEELQHVLERIISFEAVPSPRFRTNLMKEDFDKLQEAM